MNNLYPIDATIISILFDIRDEQIANEAYEKIKDLQERFFDKSLVDYMFSKGVTEDQLRTFFEADVPEDYPEIANLYKSTDFIEYSNQKSNEFNKRIYDERLPLLKDENKKALENYLKELDATITDNMNALLPLLNRNNMGGQDISNLTPNPVPEN